MGRRERHLYTATQHEHYKNGPRKKRRQSAVASQACDIGHGQTATQHACTGKEQRPRKMCTEGRDVNRLDFVKAELPARHGTKVPQI